MIVALVVFMFLLVPQGIYRWTDGSIYEGSWTDNVIDGPGCYLANDGRSFKGQWSDRRDGDFGMAIFFWTWEGWKIWRSWPHCILICLVAAKSWRFFFLVVQDSMIHGMGRYVWSFESLTVSQVASKVFVINFSHINAMKNDEIISKIWKLILLLIFVFRGMARWTLALISEKQHNMMGTARSHK